MKEKMRDFSHLRFFSIPWNRRIDGKYTILSSRRDRRIDFCEAQT